jgi:hypothetical protein
MLPSPEPKIISLSLAMFGVSEKPFRMKRNFGRYLSSTMQSGRPSTFQYMNGPFEKALMMMNCRYEKCKKNLKIFSSLL